MIEKKTRGVNIGDARRSSLEYFFVSHFLSAVFVFTSHT